MTLHNVFSDLYALYVLSQSAHWCAKGEMYYGDHLLFQRMYETIATEIDLVAEKMLGTGEKDNLLTPKSIIIGAAKSITMMTNGSDASALMIAETKFLTNLVSVLSDASLSEGVKNMLQGIADKHEEHVYLLSRRLGAEQLQGFSAVVVSTEAKKKKKKKGWFVGGPISTGPDNPGFNSSAGDGGEGGI
jgi:DNA-binding ferritin-like protein